MKNPTKRKNSFPGPTYVKKKSESFWKTPRVLAPLKVSINPLAFKIEMIQRDNINIIYNEKEIGMICPHLLIKTHPKLICRCESTKEMSEVKTEQINEYCATEQYDHCRFFQNTRPTITQEIYHEVFRAIG